MLSMIFMSCIMACLVLDTISVAASEQPLLFSKERITQYKRRAACDWVTSVSLGLTTFATGVVLTAPLGEGVIPESEVGAKLAWSAFGVSTACLGYSFYKFMRVRNQSLLDIMRAKSNFLVRHIGSISVAGIALGSAVGFMGNQFVMGNILAGFGVLGAACDSAMPYVHYYDLDAELQKWK